MTITKRVKLFKIIGDREQQVAEGYPMGPEVGSGLWILDPESREPIYFRTNRVKGFKSLGDTTYIDTVGPKFVMRRIVDNG